jgi:hypothetical protein
MAAEDEGPGRGAGEGDPGVAGGVEVAGYFGPAGEVREFGGEPVAGLLPGGGEGEALGAVGVGGEGGEFAEVGDDLVGSAGMVDSLRGSAYHLG